MFKVDTFVDTAATNTKTVLGYIPHDDLRTGFETIVDAHAAYTKTIFNTGAEIAKIAADSVIKSTTDLTKAKK